MAVAKVYSISAAYEWPKEGKGSRSHPSALAVKALVAKVQSRLASISKKAKKPLPLNYRRLRASAGALLLESIMSRIIASNSLVIDISSNNRNVHIEMGIALMYSRLNPKFRLYLIRRRDPAEARDTPPTVPSDLQGLFITDYTFSNGKVVFKDNGSLLMSIVGDIIEYYQQHGTNEFILDEITEH